MGSGSSRPNFARSCCAISAGTLGLAASSWNGSPGARATTENSTMLMPSSAGTAIRSRRMTYLDMVEDAGAGYAGPRPDLLPLAVPERKPPEVRVPPRHVGALQPVGDRRHYHAPQHGNNDRVLDDEVVHPHEVSGSLDGVHFRLGGLPRLVVVVVAPARDVPALPLVGFGRHLPRGELVHEPLGIGLGHGR